MLKAYSLIIFFIASTTSLAWAQFPSSPNNGRYPVFDPNDNSTKKVTSAKFKVVRDGQKFYKGSKSLNWKELKNILGRYPEMKSANLNRGISHILSSMGGYLIGYGIVADANLNGDPIWEMIGVGGILATISFPLYQKALNKVEIATHKYNKSIQTSSHVKLNNLSVAANKNGIGLTLNF